MIWFFVCMGVWADAYNFHVVVKPTEQWPVESADKRFWSSIVTLPALIDVKSLNPLDEAASARCLDQWRWINSRELWVRVKRECLQLDLVIDVSNRQVNPDLLGGTSATTLTEINGSYPQLELDIVEHVHDAGVRFSKPIVVTTKVPLKIMLVCSVPDGSVWNVQNLDESAEHSFIIYDGLEGRLTHQLAPLSSTQVVTSYVPPFRIDQAIVSWLGRRWGKPYENYLVPEASAAQPLSPVLFHTGYRSCFCGLNVVCRPESGHIYRQAVRTINVVQSTRTAPATMVANSLFQNPETNQLFASAIIAFMVILFLAAVITFVLKGANLLPDTYAGRAFARSVMDPSNRDRETEFGGDAEGEQPNLDAMPPGAEGRVGWPQEQTPQRLTVYSDKSAGRMGSQPIHSRRQRPSTHTLSSQKRAEAAVASFINTQQ
jgi:hypothetical protein